MEDGQTNGQWTEGGAKEKQWDRKRRRTNESQEVRKGNRGGREGRERGGRGRKEETTKKRGDERSRRGVEGKVQN